MTSEQTPLEGKTALVTGGGSGIGRAIALALADAGYKTAIAGRRAEMLAQVAASHTGEPPMVWHAVDVADRQSVADLFAWAEEELPPIDILVNAAGINVPRRTMADSVPEEWDRVMAINATGPFNCIRHILPAMRQRGDGLIVNISSISGLRASSLGGIAYCASKFALSALTTAAGLEACGEGVRLTNIYPGEVDTPILDQRPQPVSEERRAKILQPEDVAAAVMMVVQLPPRAHVPELVIKPVVQEFS